MTELLMGDRDRKYFGSSGSYHILTSGKRDSFKIDGGNAG